MGSKDLTLVPKYAVLTTFRNVTEFIDIHVGFISIYDYEQVHDP